MSTTLQLVLSNPIAGMEAEFNEWYGKDHFQHGVLTPGVEAGQRFKRAAGPWPSGKHDFLMIWEIGEPGYVLSELAKVKGSSDMPISPAIDMTTVQPPTMWRRAIIYTQRRVARDSLQRGSVIFALYNAASGEDAEFSASILSKQLLQLADAAGVFSAEYLTLADEQIRGNARKYGHGLLIELTDEQPALDALKNVLGQFPHADREKWMAILFRPLGERLTKQAAKAFILP